MILMRMRDTVDFVNARLITSNVPTIVAFQCHQNVTELTIVEITRMRFSVPVPKERTCSGKEPFKNDVTKNWILLDSLIPSLLQSVKARNKNNRFYSVHNASM